MIDRKILYVSFGFVEVPEHYKEGEEMPAILKLWRAKGRKPAGKKK